MANEIKNQNPLDSIFENLNVFAEGQLFSYGDLELVQELGFRGFLEKLKIRIIENKRRFVVYAEKAEEHIYFLLENGVITMEDLSEVEYYEDLLELQKVKEFKGV